jgi:uncharacterized integral membrane protein
MKKSVKILLGILILLLFIFLVQNYSFYVSKSPSSYDCLPSWNCYWSACVDNSQSYVCLDGNNCGNDLQKPRSATKSCDEDSFLSSRNRIREDNSELDEQFNEKDGEILGFDKDLVLISFFGILILIILIIAIFISERYY